MKSVGLPKMKFILTDSMERVERRIDVIQTMRRQWNESFDRVCVCVFAYFMELALPFNQTQTLQILLYIINTLYLQSINNICSVFCARMILVSLLLLLLLPFATLKAMCRCKFNYICATFVWQWSFRNGKYIWIVDSYGVINTILSSQSSDCLTLHRYKKIIIIIRKYPSI